MDDLVSGYEAAATARRYSVAVLKLEGAGYFDMIPSLHSDQAGAARIEHIHNHIRPAGRQSNAGRKPMEEEMPWEAGADSASRAERRLPGALRPSINHLCKECFWHTIDAQAAPLAGYRRPPAGVDTGTRLF